MKMGKSRACLGPSLRSQESGRMVLGECDGNETSGGWGQGASKEAGTQERRSRLALDLAEKTVRARDVKISRWGQPRGV